MKSLKFLFLLALTTLSLEAFSQVGVTSYSIYSLGINTSPARKISGEFKMFANRTIDDLYFELDGFYNFKPREYHRFSLGLGVAMMPNEFESSFAFSVPVQLEIFPLQDFKRVSIVFELAPQIEPEDDVTLRSLWGIRYSFGD